jgi:tetratricopeptide (TPR) repeat protein
MQVDTPRSVQPSTPIELGTFVIEIEENRVESIPRDWAAGTIPSQRAGPMSANPDAPPAMAELSANHGHEAGPVQPREATPWIGIDPNRLRRWQATVDRCERWLKARRNERRVMESLQPERTARDGSGAERGRRPAEARLVRDEGRSEGPARATEPELASEGVVRRPILGIARPAPPEVSGPGGGAGLPAPPGAVLEAQRESAPVLDDDDALGRQIWDRSDQPRDEADARRLESVEPEIAHDIDSLLRTLREFGGTGKREPTGEAAEDSRPSDRQGLASSRVVEEAKEGVEPGDARGGTGTRGRGGTVLDPAGVEDQPERGGLDRRLHEAARPALPSIQMILQRSEQAESDRAAIQTPRVIPAVAPTVPQAPRSWNYRSPWLRALLLCSAIGASGLSLFLGWHWSQDDRISAGVVDALLSGTWEPSAFESLEPLPSFSWWSSTTDHLYLRGVALAQRLDDVASQDESRWLLDLAETDGPLHSGVRHARLERSRLGDPGSKSAAAPREVAALVSESRRAAHAGDDNAAHDSARMALELVFRSDPMHAPAPAFDGSSAVRRAHLPQEDQYLAILKALPTLEKTGAAGLRELLPRSPLAWLAAVRLLRLRERDEAEALAAEMDKLWEDESDVDRRGLGRAASAEASALLGRWDEARRGYEEAIKLASSPRLRSIFWLNLSDVSMRLDDLDAARTAREKARRLALGDEEVLGVVSAGLMDQLSQNEMAVRSRGGTRLRP